MKPIRLYKNVLMFTVLVCAHFVSMLLLRQFANIDEYPITKSSSISLFDYLLTILIAPIVEEILYRSWIKSFKPWHYVFILIIIVFAFLHSIGLGLLTTLSLGIAIRFYRNQPWILAMVGGSIWGLGHLTNIGFNWTSFLAFIEFFCSAMVLSFAMLRGNLLWCIALHIAWNIYAVNSNEHLNLSNKEITIHTENGDSRITVVQHTFWKEEKDKTETNYRNKSNEYLIKFADRNGRYLIDQVYENDSTHIYYNYGTGNKYSVKIEAKNPPFTNSNIWKRDLQSSPFFIQDTIKKVKGNSYSISFVPNSYQLQFATQKKPYIPNYYVGDVINFLKDLSNRYRLPYMYLSYGYDTSTLRIALNYKQPFDSIKHQLETQYGFQFKAKTREIYYIKVKDKISS